jgi:glycosyltransferase involved in cell wall biosynthesis
MEILYLTQHFELENDYDSDRYYYTCKKFVEAGYKVTVITGNLHYKTSKRRHETPFLKPVEKEHNGIKIYYVYSPEDIQKSYFRRIANYVFYYWLSRRLRKKVKRADVVYAVSPPLTTAALGLHMSKRLKAKLFVEISDVWPDVLIETGFLKNRFLINRLRKVEKKCYQRASRIIALTKGIQVNIQNKIPEKKDNVLLVTNGVDPDLFTLDKDAQSEIHHLKQRYNPENKFVCFYFGAHSLYNSLFTVIEAARILKDEPGILFVLLGGGDKKVQLIRKAEEYRLENVLFLPPVPRIKSPLWLQLAHLFLLPNLKGEFYEMNLPNKFFDYLAAAKPVLTAGKGEIADVLSTSRSGKMVEAESPEAMAAVILQFKDMDPEERTQMGQRGQGFVFEHYNRNMLTQKIVRALDDVEKEEKNKEMP